MSKITVKFHWGHPDRGDKYKWGSSALASDGPNVQPHIP